MSFVRRVGRVLCEFCAEDTPAKVSRLDFDRAYWNRDEIVIESVRRSFYEDYLLSTLTLPEYIEATTR